MRSLTWIIAAAMLAALPNVAAGQETKQKDQAQEESAVSAILSALQLPDAAEKARAAGVANEDVREVMETARRSHIPARDVKSVLEQGAQASTESGPPPNFGAFVRELVEQGVRGPELARMIHEAQAERKAQGKNAKENPRALQHKGLAKGAAKQGQAETAQSGEQDKPNKGAAAEAAQSEDQGKPNQGAAKDQSGQAKNQSGGGKTKSGDKGGQ